MGRQSLLVGPARTPQTRLIEHIQRCAIGAGQAAQATAAHLQTTVGIELGGDRRQVAIRTAGIPMGLKQTLGSRGCTIQNACSALIELTGDHHGGGQNNGRDYEW